MTYEDLYNLHQSDTGLKNRVKVALTKTAINALSGTDDEKIWAKDKLSNIETTTELLFWEVCLDSTITSASKTKDITDIELQSVIDKISKKY